ncbi:MAG TPA: carboxypeptidase-like regulatory domain-containing protein [Gemmatimonadales bacterium]|nr:carboxypeptidase-like regulatory domain-containing protein [Gemmatimonadales bacterium]
MGRFLVVAGTLFIPSQLPAQSRPLVVGQVTDTAGTPLVQAIVFVPGTDVQVLTDRHGQFVFDSLPANEVSLRAAYIGYKSDQQDSVRVARGRPTRVVFRLQLSGIKPTCTLGPK